MHHYSFYCGSKAGFRVTMVQVLTENPLHLSDQVKTELCFHVNIACKMPVNQLEW